MSSFRLCAFADEADAALDGQIKALNENGLELIELRGVDGKNVSLLTPGEAAEVYRRLEGNGIRVWSIGSPIGKVDIHEDPVKELDRFKQVLETAVICRAENIRLFSFYGTDGDRAALDEVCRRLDDMLTAARGSGVRLCHENEKGIYGDNDLRCAEIYTRLPEIAGVFDPANFVQCDTDILRAWGLLAPFIRYAHVKDAGADGHVVPAGEGIGHLPELLPLFAGAGVEVLTLEPHLKVFKGLDALEQGERPKVGTDGRLTFPNGRAAFDYALNALRGLLPA